MLGHSMGGYITLAFAKNFPQYLCGFGLLHSTAFADSEEKTEPFTQYRNY
jgi:pimeloyl-ACP methyl ester carboxylesterase